MKKHWLVNILLTLVYLSVYFIVYFQTLVNDPNTISLKGPIFFLGIQLFILNIIVSIVILTIKKIKNTHYNGNVESQISRSMTKLYNTDSIKKKTELYLYISSLYLRIGDYLQSYNCLLKIDIHNLNSELLECYYEYYSEATANLPKKENHLNTSLEYINKALEISTFKELVISKINLLISLDKIDDAKDLFNKNEHMLINSKSRTLFKKRNGVHLLRSKTDNFFYLNYSLAYYYFFVKEYDLSKKHLYRILNSKYEKNIYLIKSKILLELIENNKKISPKDLISEFNKRINSTFKEDIVYSYINKDNPNRKIFSVTDLSKSSLFLIAILSFFFTTITMNIDSIFLDDYDASIEADSSPLTETRKSKLYKETEVCINYICDLADYNYIFFETVITALDNNDISEEVINDLSNELDKINNLKLNIYDKSKFENILKNDTLYKETCASLYNALIKTDSSKAEVLDLYDNLLYIIIDENQRLEQAIEDFFIENSFTYEFYENGTFEYYIE